MTRLLGTGEGNTVVILTDKESAEFRKRLQDIVEETGTPYSVEAIACMAIFNRGIARGTERVKAEFAEMQKARKAGAK